MNEYCERLVLRYDPGQYTFRHYDNNASDAQLYALARQLNSVQAEEVKKITKVQVFRLR